jgi:hypothetical protein
MPDVQAASTMLAKVTRMIAFSFINRFSTTNPKASLGLAYSNIHHLTSILLEFAYIQVFLLEVAGCAESLVRGVGCNLKVTNHQTCIDNYQNKVTFLLKLIIR